MIQNQLGTRNLNDFQRVEIVRKYEDAVKAQAEQRMLAGKADPKVILPEGQKSRKQSRDELGTLAGTQELHTNTLLKLSTMLLPPSSMPLGMTPSLSTPLMKLLNFLNLKRLKLLNVLKRANPQSPSFLKSNPVTASKKMILLQTLPMIYRLGQRPMRLHSATMRQFLRP